MSQKRKFFKKTSAPKKRSKDINLIFKINGLNLVNLVKKTKHLLLEFKKFKISQFRKI